MTGRVLAFLVRLAAVAAMLLTSSQAMGAECLGSIGPETSITGKSEYDPFGPADLAESYPLSVTNTGASACSFGLVLRARTTRPQLGGTLAYVLADADGAPLVPGAPDNLSPPARIRGQLAPSARGEAEIQVLIPRGQFAAPGVYRDTLDLELTALDASGRAQGASLHSTTLAISYSVPRIMSVNLRGGELMTTLGFGVLATGQQRGVEIQARSNEGYQLDVSSDNRGVLALTPKPPGQNWTVPYTATLGGAPLDLTGRGALRGLPPTRPESDAAYPLTITIGEVGQKRAGRYEDVITIEILSAIP
jgi:hypothetical protein